MHEPEVLLALAIRAPGLALHGLEVSVFLDDNRRGAQTPAVAIASAVVEGEHRTWVGRCTAKGQTGPAIRALIEAIALRRERQLGLVKFFDAVE